MDTNGKLPPHISVGAYIRVAEWTGRIIDIAHSDHGCVLVLVDSPKVRFRGIGPEWLEYHFDNPDLIKPATQMDWHSQVEMYEKRMDKIAESLQVFP